VEDVRIGRHITLELEAADEHTAQQLVETACKKLLANLIMEGYTYKISTLA
jgi:phosphoribosylformylglycinamidine synthase